MTLALAVLVGLTLGTLHVASLLWNVRLYLAGPRGRAIALHVLRLAVAAVAMWLTARQGVGVLLAVAAGFVPAMFVAARIGVR